MLILSVTSNKELIYKLLTLGSGPSDSIQERPFDNPKSLPIIRIHEFEK